MKNKIFFTGLLLASVVCLFMVPALMAQQPQRPTPESRVQEIEKALTPAADQKDQKALILTADQKAKILKIYQDAAANAQQGSGRGGGFMGGATTAAVEKVLTPDQVKKWRAYTLQQSIDRRITQIDQAVTLTADQKKKITPIIEKEIVATTALTTAMAAARGQGQTPDMETYRNKRTELRAVTDKALESILSKDQLEKYKAMPRGGMRRQ